MLMNEQESIDLSLFMIKIQEGYSFGPFFDYIGEMGISVFCRKFQTLSSIDIIHVQLSASLYIYDECVRKRLKRTKLRRNRK